MVTTSPARSAEWMPSEPQLWRRRLLRAALAAIVFVLLAWSWHGTGMNLSSLAKSGPAFARFLREIYPPDLTWTPTDRRPFAPPLRLAGQAVSITLQVSILGTAFGAAVALGLGFLAAENLTPHWVHHPLKIVLALVRSIPVILLAILFVRALGLGAMPGVFAIAIHSVGMLGKLFAEECEAVDGGVWEALDSAGANWLQKVRYAIWPQVVPQLCSLTLFRLDMNIRESAILGLVGVSGLGLFIDNYRKAADFRSLATLVIVTMLVVLVVDQTSVYLRRRLK